MDVEQPDVPIFPVPELEINNSQIEPRLDLAKGPERPVPEPTGGKLGSRAHAHTLEEIAEDLQDVILGMSRLEQQMQGTAAAVTVLQSAVAEHSSYQLRLVESLRSDLSGDRRGLALRSVFEPAAVALDQLEAVGKGFDPEKDQALYGQVAAAAATLSNLLQSLGFTRFAPDLGDRFDPTRMQCLGYAEGEPGVVLQVLRPGYFAGQILMRASGVLIADPE